MDEFELCWKPPPHYPPIATCGAPSAPGAQTVFIICNGVDTTQPQLQWTRPQLKLVSGETIVGAPRVHQIKWTLLEQSITVHITSDLGLWDDGWPREASVIHCPRQQLLLAKLFCDFTRQTMYWDDIKDVAWHYDAPEDHPWPCRKPLCTVAHRVQLLSKAFPPTDPSVSLYIPTAETLGHHEDLEAALADLARNHNLHLADCDTPGFSPGATDTFRLVVDDLCIFDCNPCGGGVARSNMGAGELQQSMWSRGTESENNECGRDALQMKEGERADEIRVHRTATLAHLSTPDSMPTRVYDTALRCVVSTEGLKAPYLCISHRWGELDDNLEWWLQDAARVTGVRYVWIDTECINQDNEQEKAAELRKMREYYALASCVAIILPRMTAKMRAQPASKESVFDLHTHVEANFDWLLDFIRQDWLRRIWTFQEATLARHTVVLTPRDVVNGAYVELLLGFVVMASRSQFADLLVASLSSRLASSYVVGSCCYLIRKGNLCSVRRFLGTASADPSLEAMRIEPRPLRIQWKATADRSATDWHDLVYGLLGVVGNGNRISINYEYTVVELLKELIDTGHIGAEIVLAPTISNQRDSSWAPEQLKDWIDGQQYWSTYLLVGGNVDAIVLSNGMLSVKALPGKLCIEKNRKWQGITNYKGNRLHKYDARLRLADRGAQAELSVSHKLCAESACNFLEDVTAEELQVGLFLPIKPQNSRRTTSLPSCTCCGPGGGRTLGIWVCCTEIAPGVFHRHHASVLMLLDSSYDIQFGPDYHVLNDRAKTVCIGGSGTEA